VKHWAVNFYRTKVEGRRLLLFPFLFARRKGFTVAKLHGLVEGFLSELPLDPDAMIPTAEIPWCG
jgi:hypothetical protein